MKRITPLQKKIIEAHLLAAISQNFDIDVPKVGDETVRTKEDMIHLLKKGKTIHQVHYTIQSRYVSMTSQLYAFPQIFGTYTDAYKRQYTQGFKSLLNSLNIQ
jgi:hypothetical protein